MSEALEKRLNELRGMAAQYAQAESHRQYLLEYRKSKKAILMIAAEKQGFNAVAAQEREAYANSEYLDLLAGLEAAIQDAERLKWELKIAEAGMSVWQSLQANKRAEMRHLNA
jgi:hypothetical protein